MNVGMRQGLQTAYLVCCFFESVACKSEAVAQPALQERRTTKDETPTPAASKAPQASAFPIAEVTPLPAQDKSHSFDGRICTFPKGNRTVGEADLRANFVDGNELLALVNRTPTGALAPNYVPSDLVRLSDLSKASKKECEGTPCLRQEAATALRELLAEMKKREFPGLVESAYRSYDAQCVTFQRWAAKSNFCSATEQSALPGHSQHQLGTTVDLFTVAWKKADPEHVFRNGFGCTAAGGFLREEAWTFGFVMPYPIHADDRHPTRACETRSDEPVGIHPITGYRNEAWHIRYIGKANAAALHEQATSKPGFTLEEFIREKKQVNDEWLPICDGCNCGTCSTLGGSPCGRGALALTRERTSSFARPKILHVKEFQDGGSVRIEARISITSGVLTQPPVLVAPGGYASGESFERVQAIRERPPHSYPPLAGACRFAARKKSEKDWPFQFALTRQGALYNKVNVRLPAESGEVELTVRFPGSVADGVETSIQGDCSAEKAIP